MNKQNIAHSTIPESFQNYSNLWYCYFTTGYQVWLYGELSFSWTPCVPLVANLYTHTLHFQPHWYFVIAAPPFGV